MSDTYLDQHLASLPAVVDAETLARFAGWKVNTIYMRAFRQRKDPLGNLHLLPSRLVVPGSNELIFTRQAVVDWFASAVARVPEGKPRRGRPKGATSRRGVGREDLEARS